MYIMYIHLQHLPMRADWNVMTTPDHTRHVSSQHLACAAQGLGSFQQSQFAFEPFTNEIFSFLKNKNKK